MVLSSQRGLSSLSTAADHTRRGPARTDGLTLAQRNGVIGVIALAHVAGAWGLLQVREVREAVREVAPMFVSIIVPLEPLPMTPVPPPLPQPIKRRAPPPAALIAAPPSPSVAAFVAPPVAPEPPLPAPPVIAVAAVEAPPVPASLPPPPPVPRLIPASAVQYLEPPVLEYPRLSRRLGESGRVSVRVYIDTAGRPGVAQLSRSSGHARLDDAALAAVRLARFKPYTENGVATAGWATIPLDFELEK